MIDPICGYDPDGTIVEWIILGLIAAAAVACITINDVITIKEYENQENSKMQVDEKNVKIGNSFKMVSPWMIIGYSIYLNYFKDETKDVFKGSSSAIAYEWMAHNIGAFFFGKQNLYDADIGPTIFNDLDARKEKGNKLEIAASIAMCVSYAIFSPFTAIFDYGKYKGLY